MLCAHWSLWAQNTAKNVLKMSPWNLTYGSKTYGGFLSLPYMWRSQCHYYQPSSWCSVPLKILSGQQEEGLDAGPSRMVRIPQPSDMLCRRQMRYRRRNTWLCSELALMRIRCRSRYPWLTVLSKAIFQKKDSLPFDLHSFGLGLDPE